MTLAFISIALVVGAVCGALMGYETRDLKKQPGGWRPWALLVIVAILVVSGAIAVEKINAEVPLSAATKTLSAVLAAVAFAASLIAMRRKRS